MNIFLIEIFFASVSPTYLQNIVVWNVWVQKCKKFYFRLNGISSDQDLLSTPYSLLLGWPSQEYMTHMMNHHSREVKKYLKKIQNIYIYKSIQNIYFLRRCTSKLVESKTFLQVTQFYVFNGLLNFSTAL